MRKCSECKENAAVLFIQDLKDRTKVRGLCLSCAKKMKIPGLEGILNSSGIDIDNVDELTEQMNEVASMMDGYIESENKKPSKDEILNKVIDKEKYKNIGSNISEVLDNIKEVVKLPEFDDFIDDMDKVNKNLGNLFKYYKRNYNVSDEEKKELEEKIDSEQRKSSEVLSKMVTNEDFAKSAIEYLDLTSRLDSATDKEEISMLVKRINEINEQGRKLYDEYEEKMKNEENNKNIEQESPEQKSDDKNESSDRKTSIGSDVSLDKILSEFSKSEEFAKVKKDVEQMMSFFSGKQMSEKEIESMNKLISENNKRLKELFENAESKQAENKKEEKSKYDIVTTEQSDTTIEEKDVAVQDKKDEDDGLIDISTLEEEMKKMLGGKGGIFEISVSSANGLFDGIKNMFGEYNDIEERVETNDKYGKKKKTNLKNIDKFGTNLTQRAKNEDVDPVIGRQKEIERVIQILNRRTKNNPVLIGEPGVGKTAIAEGLAYKIAKGEVPQKLLDYEVVQLDMASIVAGTQFRGQFETRMKNIIDEAKNHGKIILVIDEIHSIMGAGDSHGTMDAANILKPALAKGDIQIIGATTINEYKKHIEKDKALERRLQSVLVEEPTVDDTIEILKGLKDYYENYHKIILSDSVIETAVKLSSRYITDRYLPDKAIDIIDELGSKVNLKNTTIHEIQSIKESIDTLVKNQETATANSDYEKAAEYKTKQLQLETELENLKEKEYVKVSSKQVAEVIEQWTKIPVKEISYEETERLMNLEKRLQESVVGQDSAIKLIAKAIRRNRAGISAVKKPSSFIFVGPTGVGKTQLVKSLAKDIFGSEEMIIRVDMSEYMEKHSVSKLVGAPPGYVGFDEGGQLTDKVKRKPYSIILLDEIEKAHPDVFNMLLQILDDGRLTDAQGNIVHFENTIVIMTSNIGTTFKNKSLGFGSSEEDKENIRVHDALKEHFKPEFLNRIDEIVVFNRLSKENLRDIVNIMIKELQEVVKDKGINIKISDEVRDFLVEKGYDEKYGARPLRRVIQKYVEDEIADVVIANDIKNINMLNLQLLNQKIMIEKA